MDGWSDHCAGLHACFWALANGVDVVEAHLMLPGRGRDNAWDKTPKQFMVIRDFADSMGTIRTGVATRFRNRWSA
jgi:sialic acid synthase SpsE